MAINTWLGTDGTNPTHWSVAANWSDGVPTDDDDVIIPDCTGIGTCTIDGSSDVSCGSFELKNSGAFDMNGNGLILKGKNANNRMIDLGSTITSATWDGTVSFIPDAASGTFRIFTGTNATQTLGAVVVNKAGTTMQLRTGFKCSSLTITAGTFDTYSTDNNALTVTGVTDIDGTLTCNDSTIICTGNVHGAGTINFMTSDFTANDNLSCQNLNVGTAAIDTADQFGSTSDDGGATIIATGAASISCKRFHAKACTPSTMTVTLDGSTHTSAINMLAGTLYHLIVNSSGTKTLSTNTTVGGNLTITAGTLTTGADKALTVGTLGAAGQEGVIVDGTLTLNGSTCILTNLAGTGTLNAPTTTITIRDRAEAGTYAGRAIDVNNMTVNNDLKIELTSSKAQDLDLGDDKVHDLTINNDTDARQNYLGGNCSIDGDLIITRGIFNTFNRVFEADGDCTIAADGTLDANTNGGQALTLGSLTIESGGICNATRTTTTITGGGHCFTDKGTFTHNDGKVEFTVTGDNAYIGDSSTQETVFYDLFPEVEAGYHLAIYKTITVARELHINTDRLFKINCGSRAVTLKLGTSSSAGEIHQDGGGFQFASNTSNVAKIMAVDTSGLNPWINVAGYNIDWDSGGSGSDVELENGNYNGTTTTGGGGVTVKLTGDMEFDEVTISAGDKLDLNGQRLFSSDILNCGAGGVLDLTGGSFLLHDRCNWNGTGNDDILTDSNTVIWNTSSDAIAVNTTAVDNGGRLQGVFITDSSAHSIPYYGGLVCSKLIVMSGLDTVDGTNNPINCTDLTVPTGATLNGRGSTITVSGDWTSSGGLIGKSAFDFDGASGLINAGNDSSIDNIFAGGGTMEAWINVDGDGETGSGRIFSKNWDLRTYGHSGDTVNIEFSQFFASGKYQFQTGAVLTTGKWHHIAMTYNDADPANRATLYVDGKSVPLTTSVDTGVGAATDDSSTDLVIGNVAADNKTLEGIIAMIRMFGDVRTQSEIRADMFNKFADMVNTGDLELMYQFDEGTGTSVADVSAESNTGTITLGSSSWAGGGGYTLGTSTLTMAKTGTQYIYGKSGLWLNNLTVNNGSTTKLSLWNGNSNHQGNLITVGTGIFESDNNETVYLRNAGDTITVGTSATGIVGIHAFITALGGGSLSFPACSVKTLTLEGSGDTVSGGGDMIFTSKLQIKNGTEFSCNGKSHTAYTVDLDGTGRINLNGASLTFSSAAGLTSETNSTIAAANTTITGVVGKSIFESQNNFKIVGTCENLNVTNEELRVTGRVINCTGDIIQQHPTIDANQQLDYDTADDRDVMMGRDLDKNTELVT
jgi:fibronectin-binding autotransporter adhesin